MAYLKSDDHDVSLADQADDYGALLDGLPSVLDLEISALRRTMKS